MACKGDGGLEIFETEFASRKIDLRCFAYDFLVYSAEIFGIQGSFISEWQNTGDDYGCSDFKLVISRLVFVFQISLRSKWNEIFESYFEKDKLESFNAVSDLWVVAATRTIQKYRVADFFIEVEILLALTNELIQFLFSKSRKLYVADLAKLWCDWIIAEKKTFERDGGLKELYETGKKPFFQFLGDFNAKYIKEYFVPYEKFARDKTLTIRMQQLYDEAEKAWENGTYIIQIDDPSQKMHLSSNCETRESDATLNQDQAPGNRAHEYAASETIARREHLRHIRTKAISDAIKLGKLPKEYLKDPSRLRARLSRLHATKEQALNQKGLQSESAERFKQSSYGATLRPSPTKPISKDTVKQPTVASGNQNKLYCKGGLDSTLEWLVQQVRMEPKPTFKMQLYSIDFKTYAKIERISDQKLHTEDDSGPSGEQAKKGSSGEQKKPNYKDGSGPTEEGDRPRTSSQSLRSQRPGENKGNINPGLFNTKSLALSYDTAKHRVKSGKQKTQNSEDDSNLICGLAKDPIASSSEQQGQSSKNKSSSIEEQSFEIINFETLQTSDSETSDATQCVRSKRIIPKKPAMGLEGSSGKKEVSGKQKNTSEEQASEEESSDSSAEMISWDKKSEESQAYDESVFNVAGMNDQICIAQ